MPEWDGPSLLVVGYNGSTASCDALAYAIGMARREKSDVAIVEVHALTSGSPVYLNVTDVFVRQDRSGTTVLTTELAQDLETLLPGRWWVEVCTGDPATELERVAEELRSDAIVIGRCRRSTRRSLGSVAGRLIQSGRRPVIVVP